MCPTGTTAHRHSGSLRSAFHVIDADNDGRISRNDLRQFYTSNADVIASSDDDVIGSMFHVADSNKDGYVEYEEFEKVVVDERETRREKGGVMIMEEAFKKMDRDGDGIVGREDLKGFLEWAGLQAHDEDVEAMIRLGCVGGGDDNNGVSFDGFLKILAL